MTHMPVDPDTLALFKRDIDDYIQLHEHDRREFGSLTADELFENFAARGLEINDLNARVERHETTIRTLAIIVVLLVLTCALFWLLPLSGVHTWEVLCAN